MNKYSSFDRDSRETFLVYERKKNTRLRVVSAGLHACVSDVVLPRFTRRERNAVIDRVAENARQLLPIKLVGRREAS